MAYGLSASAGGPFFLNRAGGHPRKQQTMALVNIPLGRKAKFFTEWTVVGEDRPGMTPGDIRWTGWNKTCVPPQLEVSFESHDGKRVAAKRISISAEYEARGWNTLRELYEKDPERKEFWPDWLAFCEAQEKNPIGMRGTKEKPIVFPESKLPRAVEAMRKTAAKAQAEAAAFRFADGSGLEPEPELEAEPKAKPAPKKAASAKA